MQCLYVCKNDDGSVIVAPAPDVQPDQLKDGETFSSVQEAAQAVEGALGDGQTEGGPDNEQQEPQPDAEAPEGEGGGDTGPSSPSDQEEESAMSGGYKDARQGR